MPDEFDLNSVGLLICRSCRMPQHFFPQREVELFLQGEVFCYVGVARASEVVYVICKIFTYVNLAVRVSNFVDDFHLDDSGLGLLAVLGASLQSTISSNASGFGSSLNILQAVTGTRSPPGRVLSQQAIERTTWFLVWTLI